MVFSAGPAWGDGGGGVASWTSAPLEQAMRVQGDLELRVTVKSQQTDATTGIVAYLLDADPAAGKAYIVTHAALTSPADRRVRPPP
ncbi:CocE/NonD family hydrolase C-terminal non-catalytic domain-containing protein [Streptomyces sp. NPDC046237]|uniref:CocE/NonD family hydrolase C-terminal non-catalytic domain-containing protein n=1 Tax=Streptomyces sp. NPDC046237 TaxID=3154914 RepID=UPI0033D3BB12